MSSPQPLDEPPPAYPAMASDASDSVSAHTPSSRLTRTRLPLLPFLPFSRTPHLCPPLCSSLSLSPRRPARTLGPYPCLGFTYLGHSSSTMSLCRYFRQRACLGDEPSLARLPPTKMGAKAVSPRNATTNTAGPRE